ncbi:hypothetical protein [Mucisphaera calidilacus]|uniref:Uncharacterized protein n=1 Tax=Mucisphaera calidilacus TaxID=2527982 RepID=A0A518BY57_9BACT|nr:hypothetical protein [Mucisphaera calidilacus]QDU71913.1 hypothetical protein Pan265_17720 [Mucisphaera calidilacus]
MLRPGAVTELRGGWRVIVVMALLLLCARVSGKTVGIAGVAGLSEVSVYGSPVVIAVADPGDAVVLVPSLATGVLEDVLATVDLMVIAQLDDERLGGGLRPGGRDLLARYVETGGGLLVMGRGSSGGVSLLDRVFGWSLGPVRETGVATTTLVADGVLGGGPAEVAVDPSGLVKPWRVDEAGLISVYADRGWSGVVVGEIGDGRVGYVSMDTRLSALLGPESLGVIERVSVYAAGAEPVVIPLPGSVWAGIVLLTGLVVYRWLRRQRH